MPEEQMTRRKLTLTEKLEKAGERLRRERYDPETIADALQTSVVKALERKLDLDALPASWYLTTARRCATDALRRDSRAIPTDPDKLDHLTQTRPQTGK